MSKRIVKLLKNFSIFIGLLILGHLADHLPDALWSFVIQIGLYGGALVIGGRLLMLINQSIDNQSNYNDEK